MTNSQQLRRLEVRDVRVIETPGKVYDVRFDLDWREAFRDGQHWSAAWVFVKINLAQTEQVESVDAAVDTLVDGDPGSEPRLRDMFAHTRADVVRGLGRLAAKFPPGKRPPDALLPPGLRGRIRALADAEPDDDPALERNLPALPHMIRVQHSRVSQAGKQVEIDDGFAFLHPDANGKHTITRFTKWRHLPLAADARAHQPPAGVVISPSADGIGVFVYRDQDGRGPLELRGVRLRTTLPCNGEAFKIWVGALEMVRVPTSPFFAGDPLGAKGPTSCLYHAGSSDDESQAYPVASEDEIAVGSAAGQLTWNNTGQMGTPANVPAPFPKGHRAFYMLKHQVTQAEYTDFINHLNGNQITIRFPYGGQGEYRYAVFKTMSTPRVCTRSERAANWMSWADARAYLWWAGLRPMTELEYEKAARGPADPVSGEYAWGSTTLVQSVVILGDESGRPIVQGNCNIGNPMQLFQGGDGSQGPVPDDAFRASRYQDHAEAIHRVPESEQTFTAREETGASYYGIMGLSGNLWEFVVSLGTDKGRRYIGEHGNGNLDAAAGPEGQNSWPTPDNQGVGFRGGSWYTKTSSGRVADRCFGSGLTGYSERSHDTGVRGVRTAPEEP
jgi:formylglycine-generating enzyme required for sulfatase activity